MPRPLVALFAFLLPISLFAAGHDLSTSVRYAPSDSPSDVATVAFNSGHFLTLWPMASHIYGALADPSSGTMPPAFPVLPFANPSALKVTAAGSGYLAVWNQQDVPYLGALTSDGVLARRMPLDAGKLWYPKIVSNGNTVLVVDLTLNGGAPATIVASLYDLNGHAIRRYTLPVSGADSYDVTNADGEFAIVTAGTSGVNEWRLANDGTVLSTLQIEPPPANPNARSYNASVAWKSGRLAVAWMQPQWTTSALATIQPDGSITRLVLLERGPASGITVLPVDMGFVFAWNVGPTPATKAAVYAVRQNLGGVLLDDPPVNLGGDGGFLAAASSGNAIEFALLTSAIAAPTTLIATVGAGGISARATMPTAVTPVRQLPPALSGNFAGFTAAWIERSSGIRDVVVGRVAHDGQPIDGPGIALDEKSASSAAIAQGASAALVVWTTNDSVLATRVTPFGVRLDATPLLIAKQQQFPDQVAVAWNGSRYFVIWSAGFQLQSAFVSSEGVATTPQPLGYQTTTGNFAAAPDVTWDGRQFVVVFGEVSLNSGCGLCPVPIPDHIRVMRVSSTGDAIDVNPLRIPGNYIRAHVASSGQESLIALDGYHDVSTVVVHDEDGALHLDPVVPLFYWPVSAVSSDVTWDGSTYVVGWEYPAMPNGPSAAWLAAARLTQSGLPFGKVVTPVAAPESVSDSQSWGPAIAANDAREVALGISEMLPQTYVPRARLYLLTDLASMPAPPPAPRNAVSLFGGRTARIDWQGDDVPGYLVEWSFDFGATWRFYTVLPGTARSITVPASIGNLFRISAFGPGGVSAATITSIGSEPRRRAVRR